VGTRLVTFPSPFHYQYLTNLTVQFTKMLVLFVDECRYFLSMHQCMCFTHLIEFLQFFVPERLGYVRNALVVYMRCWYIFGCMKGGSFFWLNCRLTPIVALLNNSVYLADIPYGKWPTFRSVKVCMCISMAVFKTMNMQF
jgi:hypothetical protein